MRERDDHVLRRNEILDAEVLRIENDLGAALVAELGANSGQFLDDDFADALGPIEDIHEIGDAFEQLGIIGNDLVAFEAGQALQAQFEDGLRLRLG